MILLNKSLFYVYKKYWMCSKNVGMHSKIFHVYKKILPADKTNIRHISRSKKEIRSFFYSVKVRYFNHLKDLNYVGSSFLLPIPTFSVHIPYSWNIMCQKWEGDSGLWDLHEIIRKMYTESLKKFVRAVWELPAK